MDNIILALGIIIFVSLIGVAVCYFFRLEKEKQIETVLEWLTYAVMKAEKELGSGTGQLKLRYVYDLFLSKFGFLSKVIAFEQFSGLVDQALISMKDFLSESEKLKEYIEQ